MILIGVALVNAFLVQRMQEALTLEKLHANRLSPDTGEKAVARQNFVSRPFSMLRE